MIGRSRIPSEGLYCLTGLAFTSRCGFDQSVYIFESLCQSTFESDSSRSKFHIRWAKVVRVSIHPRLFCCGLSEKVKIAPKRTDTGGHHLFPRQPLAPKLKGWLASRSSEPSYPSNHRSGLKAKGSVKFTGSKLAATGLVATTICGKPNQFYRTIECGFKVYIPLLE